MADITLSLNDRSVLNLPPPANGRYFARDPDLRGFHVVVGARKKTFAVKGEYWKDGKRYGRTVTIGHAGDISVREARTQAKAILAKIASGELFEEGAKPGVEAAVSPEQTPNGITLRQAWHRYRSAHMERKDRSEATIRGYADHVERLLADWLDTPLMALGENPSMVAERHDKLTTENGPSAANGAMRTLRAIYNHARKSHRTLPPENPTLAVDWNREKRRDTAMGLEDLPGWFAEVRRLRHPIRREFHLFTLLSGSRPDALKQARLEHLSFKERVLHIPRPKGGADRAFDIPLSRPMMRCLIRAIRASRLMFPEAAEEWIFAADSAAGHMIHHKEVRTVLSKWGGDLRQTYRTLGQAVGLSEVDMHLLMNHSLPGVNAGYITRAKLLSGHLQAAQEKLSQTILEASGAKAPAWPLLVARRIGDPICDPTPPDPRSNQAREDRFWAVDAPRLLKMAQAQLDAAPEQSLSRRPAPRMTEAPPRRSEAPTVQAVAPVRAYRTSRY